MKIKINYYNSSLLERYLNYIAGSSDVIPSEVDSRLAEYLRYLCLNGTIKEQQIVSQLLPLKADLVDGKVPSTQLPSYVSEIVEIETYADLPEEGDANVVYVVRSPSTATYRWTGTQYIALDEQGQYFSVKVSSTNITTMAELRTYITNINNYGMHCFFDFSDFITNGYICTVLLFETNDVNYCVIFDVINGKTYVDYAGYEDTDTVQNYVSRTGDNIPRVISISDNTTTTTQDDEYINSYPIPYSGMFDNTGGTFTGTPTSNTTYYTSNTVV